MHENGTRGLRTTALTGRVGPAVVVALPLAVCLLWWWARPAGEQTGSYVGQLAGALSVLLMSEAMVLVSTLPWVDTWFDGIDRAAIWHRRVAILGLVLLLPHILLAHHHSSSSWANPAGVVATVGLVTLAVWAILPRWRSITPRAVRGWVEAARAWPPADLLGRLLGSYDLWRQVHRLTGLFLAIGFAHGLADASPFADAPVLAWVYVVTSGIGLAFYVYRELFARRGHGLRDYQVARVSAVGEGLTEVALRPLGKPLRFSPGQFAMLNLEAKDGWHRHPFTLAGSPSEPELRVTIKALGDYTSSVGELVRPGMPAVVSGPHGRFTHAKGTADQVWIAGGVGVTPFLSWLRSLEAQPPRGRVDLFYSVADEAPYLEEIEGIVDAHDDLHLHLVRSRVDGRLTAERVLDAVPAAPADVSVFLCGPEPMVASLQRGLVDGGVRRSRLFREHFDWR
ncbi:hypothetical protein [Nocardioides sp. GY 10127]|uniref:ferredoxin reductase family protein n=1 Tax=Nocardioides sp. GY 10127 TaxID=2569762 RepID=UPI0010A7BAC7|nr:hypothetical protein [Nocardioides sp. GY 10127]TIC80016.1 hypothetical protein E8D37_15395 [Nocardioides sp. GY 10127]